MFFTSVAASAYLNASRSSSGMCSTASMASRFSVRLTGQAGLAQLDDEAVEQVEQRLADDASVALGSCTPVSVTVGRQRYFGPGANCFSACWSAANSLTALAMSVWYLSRMLAVLGGRLGVDLLDAQQHQRVGPVERLGHRRRLLQLELADRAHDAGHLVGQVVGDVGHLGEDDLLLALHVGVVDVEEEAAPLERLGELTGVVRGEEHQRDLLGGERAQLGDRHLVVGEDLEQQRLGLDLDAVDLVDEQHDRVVGPDGLEQRAGEQELVGEEVVLDLVPACSPSPRSAWMRRSCFL